MFSVGMGETVDIVVVVVRPGRSVRRAGQVLRWVRCLLPAAFLIVSAAQLSELEGVITIDADAVESPLSVADALLRNHR